jgi:glycosyltransferase involved in cell wall biosynthesis
LNAIDAARPLRVVHTNFHHALLLMPLLDPRRDIYWSHEVIPERGRYGLLFRAIAKRVRCVVCVSQAVANSLTRIGIPLEKIIVIHNGTTEAGAPTLPGSAAGTDLRIGVVGQIAAWKGHRDLVEAFGLLAKRHEHITLTIFGRGDAVFMDQLKARITQLALEHRVTWAGFVGDAATLYDGMDICVVPSVTEDPLPTTAIEAGHYGIPVVATMRGGLPEIIDDGVTGILVPAEAPDQLAGAIERLLHDPELRRRMGRSAQMRMRSLFSERRFVDDFVGELAGHGA